MNKICIDCGDKKTLSEFQKKKDGLLGRDEKCIECKSAYRKKQRELNPLIKKAQNKRDWNKHKSKRYQASRKWYKKNSAKMKEWHSLYNFFNYAFKKLYLQSL